MTRMHAITVKKDRTIAKAAGLNLHAGQCAALIDNQVVPMVFTEWNGDEVTYPRKLGHDDHFR